MSLSATIPGLSSKPLGIGRIITGSVCFFLALVAFLAMLGTWFTVDQNEVAAVTRFSQLRYIATPGFHLKLPFVDDYQRYRIDIQAISPTKPANTYTIDNQEVDVLYTLFYRLPTDKVAFIFQNNRDYLARLEAMTTDRLKAAMGQVNVQMVAEKRGLLRDSIKETMVRDAAPLGVEVTDFQLSNLQYTDSFRAAVGNAAVQKANIESVEYQRQQAEKVAQMAKIKAEGDANAVRAAASGAADARIMQANAEAGAIKVQGEAQALAIKAQADALKANPDLVNLRRAERWNGTLPTAIYGSAPIPFLDVGKSQ